MSSAAALNIMTAPSNNAPAKNLAALLAGIATDVPTDVCISDLSSDSRKIRSNAAFVALPGLRSHGLSFAAEAIAAGATTVLWEPALGVALPVLPASVTAIAIPKLTQRLGTIADRFFDEPSRALQIAAVTGTNGKTTTAYVIAAALQRLGREPAYAGTLGFGRIAALQARTHTTPDCISSHRELAELREQGVRSIGMEISSHALDQHRVDGIRIDTAIFTNLTRDHLDYHGTLEAYASAKARLFAWPGLKHAVLNIDDEFGRELLTQLGSVATTVYSRHPAALASLSRSSERRYVIAGGVAAESLGLSIEIESSWGAATLRAPFIGDFNVDNLLAVLATLLGFGIALEDAIAALEHCSPPPGRMELLSAPGRPAVLVDYAHTPDALEKALLAVRKHCAGRVLCVFGCGGERDVGKRPLMGAIAERHADMAVVTDDNPRGEDADAIVADILRGMQSPQAASVIRDRAEAIEQAIVQAQSGDAVLIAGKGHEDYQIVGASRRYFSDRDVALAALGRCR